MLKHHPRTLLPILTLGWLDRERHAKILLGAALGDARGSVGAHTFTKGRNGAVLRQKVSPVQPRTSSVLLQRSKFASDSKVWAGPTMDGLRAGWLALAAVTNYTNVFGNTYHPTGSQLFKSCNMNLDAIGEARILDVPANLDVDSLLTLAANAAAPMTAVLTQVDATFSVAEYYYSSFTGLVPAVGMEVTTANFVDAVNNVTGTIIAATGGAAGKFTLARTAQIDATEPATASGTGFSITFTPTPIGATNGLIIQASPQLSSGRTFFGSGAKQIVATALNAASPVDITTAYTALFGAFRSGTKIQVKAHLVNSVNGAASTPISVTTTVA